MKKVYTFILCLFIQYGYSQDNKIQKIVLSDSIVYNTVQNFIEKRLREYPKFNSYGYIILRLRSYNENASGSEPLVTYKIIDQYYSFNSGSNKYPNSYTYILGKLIMIYDNWSKSFDNENILKSSKRKINKKIDKTLGKPEHVFFKDENGKVIINDKNFRPEERVNIHGGILLSIFKNGKFEVKKAYNKDNN